MSEQGLNESRLYLNKTNIHKVEPPILAIDYGLRHIGIAISDSKGIVAQPLTIIDIKKQDFNPAFLKIKEIIDEYNIKAIVLGVPQAFEKAHLQNIDSILEFRDSIELFTQKEVFLYDESYSTSNSYKILKQKGENRKKAKRKIDKIAATYFLQELIDFKNQQND